MSTVVVAFIAVVIICWQHHKTVLLRKEITMLRNVYRDYRVLVADMQKSLDDRR